MEDLTWQQRLKAFDDASKQHPVLSDLIGHCIRNGMVATLTPLEEFHRRAAKLEAEVSKLRGHDMPFILLLDVIREHQPHSIHGPLMATDAFKNADAALLPTPQPDEAG